MLTGFLDYNNLEYFFVVDEKVNQLKLISTKKHIPFSTDILRMEKPFLIGIINENRKKIVFITKQNSIIGQTNDSLYIELSAYFLLSLDESDSIDKIDFYSPEIDRIYNVNRVVDFNIAISDASRTGTFCIRTKNFEETTTEKQKFTVDGKDIYVTFQIERFVSDKIGKPPLFFQSYLSFVFEATTDYIFIINLCNYAINFIRYLCFRRNIYFTSIQLSTPRENNKHSKIGELYIYDNNHEPDQEALAQNRCIKYEYIIGNEGKILSNIVANSVYLRHLPKTLEDSMYIDSAKFVMITAAFEWEFYHNNFEKVEKNESTKNAEETVSKEIKKLFDNSSGKQKKIYRFLLRLVKSNDMKSKIIQVCKDYSVILELFAKNLYDLNHIKFDYIAKRISEQRNRFAHGNLNKEFINESLCDIYFLQYIVYTLQLKKFGLSNENIKKSINDVFNLEIPLSVLLNTTK